MAFLSQFLLGRPNFEYEFDINPLALMIDEQPVAVLHRTLSGDLKKSLLKVSAPVIRVNSNFLLKTQRDQFASLVGIKDTFLSFQTRDDWAVLLERDLPSSTTTVVIENTSATRLSAVIVAGGGASTITITGVFDNAAGTGTDYFAGGSYADATRTITLGTPLGSATDPVFVSYTYTGWLVQLKSLPHAVQGGWQDRWSYDMELLGA